jgi:uncharacterized repeat protein (TIGR02543 family)
MARVSILLITVALIAGIISCGEVVPPNRYNLTIAVAPAGSGTATDLTSSSPYTGGTGVGIRAVANPGYHFVNWTASAGGFADTNAAQTTFTMPVQNVTVTANFEEIPPIQYELTISSTAGGSVVTPGQGTFTYDADTVVNLVAEAEEGYKFLTWMGDIDTVANVNAPSTTITMNDRYSITANFEHEADEKQFFRGVLDPEGSWEYEWNHEQVFYELVIESTDRFIINSPKEEGQSSGGVSGGSSYSQAFVHIYHMTIQAGGDERRVIVAAWGDTHVFEAAVFPETQQNVCSIIHSAFGKSMEEVIQHIQAMIELSEDVIRGYTVDYHF